MQVGDSSAVVNSRQTRQQKCRTKLITSSGCRLPTSWGEFEMRGWLDTVTGLEHATLSMGDIADTAPVLARVHSECLTGDAFFSLRCDCGPQLQAAMRAIADHRRGVIVYLRQEGLGIGLLNKVRAYALQDGGADTIEANRLLGLPDDARDYRVAGDILRSLGVQCVKLMTNSPSKVSELQQLGIDVVERMPLRAGRNRYNERYLDTKRRRLGHWLDHDGPSGPNPVQAG